MGMSPLCLTQLIKPVLIPLTLFTLLSQNQVCQVNHEIHCPLLMSFNKSGIQYCLIHKPLREGLYRAKSLVFMKTKAGDKLVIFLTQLHAKTGEKK